MPSRCEPPIVRTSARSRARERAAISAISASATAAKTAARTTAARKPRRTLEASGEAPSAWTTAARECTAALAGTSLRTSSRLAPRR